MKYFKFDLRKFLSLTIIFMLTAASLLVLSSLIVSANAASILVLKWTRGGLGTNWESGLVIGDVTGEGQEDVVYAGGGSDRIYVLNGQDGSTIATYTNTRINQYCQPQLYDVDNDGIFEILVPLYYRPGLAVVEYDGDTTLRELWVRYVQGATGSGSVMSKPVAGDIDGDGDLEIYVASQDVSPLSGYDGTLTMFDHNGNMLAQTFFWRSCSGGVSLGDTDNDGVFEVYVGDRQMGYRDGGYGKSVRSFWAENLTERWSRFDFLSSSQSPVLVDVNGDGIKDVLAGMYREMNILNSKNGAMIRKWRHNAMSVHYGFTVYDIDRDGHLELFCSDGEHDNDPYADVYDLVTGQLEAELSLAGGDWKWSPVIADISPDHPGMEIICAPNGTTLNGWRGVLMIYDSSFRSIENVTVTMNDALGFPVVQDIDSDGLLELVAHSASGIVYAFDTPAPAPGYSSLLPGSKRIRSEVTYYGEARLGVAEHTSMPWEEDYWSVPLVAPISPSDNALSVPVSTKSLSFKIREHQSDPITYVVTTSPDIGSLSGSKTSGTYNWETFTLDFNKPLEYDTTYNWTVSVSDGVNTVVRTYSFRTEHAPIAGNNPPTQETPSLISRDNLNGVTSTFEASATSTDPDGDSVTNIYRWLVNGVPVANLILPFDTRDETLTKDYSGYGNDGIVKGAVWTQNGKVGGAYRFDGVDDVIIVSDGGKGYFDDKSYPDNNPELGGDGTWTEITVEAWIYLTAYNNGSRIVAKIPSYELGFASGYTNRLIGSIWPATGQVANDSNAAYIDRIQSVTADVEIQLNTWYHIAFTYKNGTGLNLYLNGQLVGQRIPNQWGPIKNSLGEPIYIGRLVEPFKGLIDEVRIYPYALPPEQIYNRYLESKDGSSSYSLLVPYAVGAKEGSNLACEVIPSDSKQDGMSMTSNTIVIGPGKPLKTLIIGVSGGGTTVPIRGTYQFSEDYVVSVEAIPNSGFLLDYWLLNGSIAGSANPYMITMDANYNLTAVFVETIFADGFESGNFNQWNGNYITSGETATVVNDRSHHGLYGARFTSNGNANYERAYCYKTITTLSEIYVRGYVYVSQSGISETNDRFYFIILRAGSNSVAYAGWRRTSSDIRWNLQIRHGTSYINVYSNISPEVNRWYSVELHWKEGSIDGLGELFVDGILVCSSTGRNTASFGGVDQVRIGLPEIAFCGSTIVYTDCVKISKTYIGPEISSEVKYKLVIDTAGNGSTNPSVGTYFFNGGSVVQVSAIPDSGYVLSYWLLDGINAGSNNPYTIIMNANHTLTAVFVEASPVILADGFDSGGFTQWSGNYITSGETITIVSSQFHHGGYCAQFTSNGDGGTERAYIYKTFDAQSEVYVRGYFYIAGELPLQDENDRFNLFAFVGGTDVIASLGVRRSGGADLWSITSIAGTWYAASGPEMNKWYCIEFYVKIGTTDGALKVWINGTLAIERTGLNTAGGGNVISVRIGLPYVYSVTQSITLYCDCLVISKASIGTEVI